MTNRVTLRQNRMFMEIHTDDGRKITLHSAREDGFTPDDVDRAKSHDFSDSAPEPGQSSRTYVFHLRSRYVFIHVNTGPPIWWLPRAIAERMEDRGMALSIGWLRILVTFAISKRR